jgi:hypothetical protein
MKNQKEDIATSEMKSFGAKQDSQESVNYEDPDEVQRRSLKRAFKKGDKVDIADLDKETFWTPEDHPGDFRGKAEVLEYREHPPGVDDPGEDPNISPHYKVSVEDHGGTFHEFWVAGSRLS